MQPGYAARCIGGGGFVWCEENIGRQDTALQMFPLAQTVNHPLRKLLNGARISSRCEHGTPPTSKLSHSIECKEIIEFRRTRWHVQLIPTRSKSFACVSLNSCDNFALTNCGLVSCNASTGLLIPAENLIVESIGTYSGLSGIHCDIYAVMFYGLYQNFLNACRWFMSLRRNDREN